MCSVLEPNTIAQRLPLLSSCCHVYCIHRFIHLYTTVTTARAVSNRESRYPQRKGFSPRAAACHSRRTIVPTDFYIPFFLAFFSASPFSSTFSSLSEIGLLLVLTLDFSSMSGLRLGGDVRSQLEKRWKEDPGDAKGRNVKSDLKKKGEKNVRSQKKVKIRCPISPEMEKVVATLIKQTKEK